MISRVKNLGILSLVPGKVGMVRSGTVPFLYGVTAFFPAEKQDKSDIVIIDIGQHPIVYSRAVATVRLEKSMTENEAYLNLCRRICEKRCPIRKSAQSKILCERLSLTRAVARTVDHSELDINQWSDVLKNGLCKPVVFE